MSRARAKAIALVNWRGVFYERYELDRHVTALEGANGSGKTTVMIAAYLVLLPDLNRLKFTNVGESGATGGDRGIYGRLGEAGAPSYAFLELECDHSPRLIAGVQVVRKAEPSLELNTFIITDLRLDTKLHDVVLLKTKAGDQVPEMAELKDNVGRFGGRLASYSSAKEYLAVLFEHGITPMRLGSDEERTKLNEMLRTSMTGGISRTLTNDLRSFLLRQEPGLADTLSTMRANLEACRRTRTEVRTSQDLEREIAEVYEAGEEMFAAAFHATRERAEEMRRTVERAREQHARIESDLAKAESRLDQLNVAKASIKGRLESSRAGLDRAEDRLKRIQKAYLVADELRERAAALSRAEEAESIANERRDLAKGDRDRRQKELKEAEGAWSSSARGLADLQEGLGELHRRAKAHDLASSSLDRAEALLAITIEPDDIDAVSARVREERNGIDREAAAWARSIATAEIQRAENERAVLALEAIAGAKVPASEQHERARKELARLRGLRLEAATVSALLEAIELSRERANAQKRCRQRAADLDLAVGSMPGQTLVERALHEAEERRDQAERQREDHQRAQQDTTRTLEDTRTLIAHLEERQTAWSEVQELLARLGETIHDVESLDRVDATLDHDRARLGASIAALAGARDEALRRASEIESAGGSFSSDLLQIRDAVGGELLAARFEDVDLEAAGVYEARLGPLAAAIAVENPKRAAADIKEGDREIDTVWFVEAARKVDLGSGGSKSDRDVIVDDAGMVRVTRIPEHPVLGRRARAQRIGELQAEAARLEKERLELSAELTRLERRIEASRSLRAQLHVLQKGDPSAELETARKAALGAANAIEEHHLAAIRARRDASAAAAHAQSLRGLLADARLLDPPDHAERLAELESKHESAVRAREEIERTKESAETLEHLLDSLRTPPLSDRDLEALRVRLDALGARRDLLFHASEALDFVAEHRAALAWTDAKRRLENEQQLVPELIRAEEQARAEKDLAQQRFTESDAIWQTEVANAQQAHSVALDAEIQKRNKARELDELAVGTPSAEDVKTAQSELASAKVAHRELEKEHEGIDRAHTEAEIRWGDLVKEEREKKLALEEHKKEAVPHEERWARLAEAAREQRALSAARARKISEALLGSASPALFNKARTAVAKLRERLRRAQRSQEVLSALEETWTGEDEDRSGESYLLVWMTVLDWLRRRLPAHIAELDDPLEALARLRDELSALEERLKGQEAQLRSTSDGVANHIEVQIRKAIGQVKRLTKHLEGVSFGSIAAVRVRHKPVESMQRILRALHEGPTQAMLFEPSLAIEDALDQIFRRYGGAGAQGQKLLDYREYLELYVEVKRKAGTDWEPATPAKLSTGEAIGVGAAVMMVVLAEWERDANVIRGRKSDGSLRFLFLDEANRLDRENLDEVFDLCQSLELQLLIASPEVARAAGTTVYRLERVVEGRTERVLVSGRRTRAS
jgi:chromosome partition protein MukB